MVKAWHKLQRSWAFVKAGRRNAGKQPWEATTLFHLLTQEKNIALRRQSYFS